MTYILNQLQCLTNLSDKICMLFCVLHNVIVMQYQLARTYVYKQSNILVVVNFIKFIARDHFYKLRLLQAMYEEVLLYQKIIDGLQETIKSLTKIDDLSARVKDIVTSYELLCSLAMVN